MIKEEYNYYDVEDYLISSIDLLISGFPQNEERSKFFYDIWFNEAKDILLVNIDENEVAHMRYIHDRNILYDDQFDLCMGLPRILRALGVTERNVLLDLSSLSHVLIMFITKQLLTNVTPRALFAAYIRPEQYKSQSGTIGYGLSEQICAVESVPGFAKRESDNQKLCAFLGFEGIRLKNVLETMHSIDKLMPIVAFPLGAPQWFNVTMWNSMDVLQSEATNVSVYKCFSESIFDAVILLNEIVSQEDKVVLAPLGTRAHSMACAIFACHHQATRIVYDFAKENDDRTTGISDIMVYHLSSFIRS